MEPQFSKIMIKLKGEINFQKDKIILKNLNNLI